MRKASRSSRPLLLLSRSTSAIANVRRRILGRHVGPRSGRTINREGRLSPGHVPQGRGQMIHSPLNDRCLRSAVQVDENRASGATQQRVIVPPPRMREGRAKHDEPTKQKCPSAWSLIRHRTPDRNRRQAISGTRGCALVVVVVTVGLTIRQVRMTGAEVRTVSLQSAGGACTMRSVGLVDKAGRDDN